MNLKDRISQRINDVEQKAQAEQAQAVLRAKEAEAVQLESAVENIHQMLSDDSLFEMISGHVQPNRYRVMPISISGAGVHTYRNLDQVKRGSFENPVPISTEICVQPHVAERAFQDERIATRLRELKDQGIVVERLRADALSAPFVFTIDYTKTR